MRIPGLKVVQASSKALDWIEDFGIPGAGFEGPNAVNAPVGIGEEEDELVLGLILGLPLFDVSLEQVGVFLLGLPGHDDTFRGKSVGEGVFG